MNSIKELKEQLGYEEIGLDDTFTFHCTQCGKCCIHREDILLLLTSHVFPTQIKNRNPSDRFFVGVPVIL